VTDDTVQHYDYFTETEEPPLMFAADPHPGGPMITHHRALHGTHETVCGIPTRDLAPYLGDDAPLVHEGCQTG
jgi:hypothetical protein